MARPPSPPGPPAKRSLHERLDGARATLTEQELRVAAAMLDDGELVYRSITEFAAEHGLGYGSVVRTCQKLGYAGFHDLKIHRAGEVPAPRPPAATAPILAEAEQAIADIRAASASLSLEAIDGAAAAIARSRSTLAIGCAGSAPVARRIEYRLSRLGVAATAVDDAHMQCIRATSLSAKDVLLAVSFSGATKEVLRAVELARARRAKIVALTNAARSPLAQRADISLVTGIRIDPVRAEVVSLVAVEFCLDALFSRIARVAPDRDAPDRTAQAVAGNLL
jgi:DNA-binding MurR/RpiR family transcriptional regulator